MAEDQRDFTKRLHATKVALKITDPAEWSGVVYNSLMIVPALRLENGEPDSSIREVDSNETLLFAITDLALQMDRLEMELWNLRQKRARERGL